MVSSSLVSKLEGRATIPVFRFRKSPRVRPDFQGFTLIELLVAMVLLGLVVSVLGMAFRVAVGTWRRGNERRTTIQEVSALYALLDRQLEAVVRVDPLGSKVPPDEVSPLFCGTSSSLSFVTSRTSMGSACQGLIRVSYVFSKEKGLLYYEHCLTRPEDMKAVWNPVTDAWRGDEEPASKLQSVADFRLRYAKSRKVGREDEEMQWKDEWECRRKGNIPWLIRVDVKVKVGARLRDQSWDLAVGMDP